MTTTPITDAAECRIVGPNPWSPLDFPAVPAEVARKLEGRLTAAKATIDAIERANHGEYGEVSDLRIAEIIDTWRGKSA